MTRRLPLLALAACLTVAAAACGSSGSDGGSAEATTTTAAATSTAPPTTSLAPPTTIPSDATTPPIGTTTAVVTPDALPDCQVLLEEYTNVFTPDDLLPAAAFFRKYAPLMPADVSASSLRIAAAYEAVGGDMTKLDFTDADLTADAEEFSELDQRGVPGRVSPAPRLR